MEACDDVARQQGFALAIHSKRPCARSRSHFHLPPLFRGAQVRQSPGRGRRRIQAPPYEDADDAVPLSSRHKVDLPRAWVVIGSSLARRRLIIMSFSPATEHREYRNEVLAKHLDDIIKAYEGGLRPVLSAAQLQSRAEEDGEVELAAISIKDINNARARHRQQQLASQTSTTLSSPEVINSE
ncbi:hypothetical protein XA68_15067 [Ophiocordyceps unilateralis]|uniref:Uncharacterized protein n=1 Tax=Ophiocordyceps unilateralis TaxID=268505 RepID=A0A2A9PMR7_OPHUN|nr:hypothetical protein XA68_15067 [Ophiocordyceps unilateralis]